MIISAAGTAGKRISGWLHGFSHEIKNAGRGSHELRGSPEGGACKYFVFVTKNPTDWGWLHWQEIYKDGMLPSSNF